MKKSIVLILLGLTFSVSSIHAQTLKTFVLVRHAEKATDDPKDPSLTAEGDQRAMDLMEMFKLEEVEAIYSTPFKRTINTVKPLADLQQVEVKEYNPFDKGFLGWVVENSSGTVFISGHSNTIPFMVNELIGEDRFEQLDDSEYNKIFVVTLTQLGNGKVMVLNY
tara:strand:+ start:3501 stop:3995 length:495 start_codon:yes stop_codon:yes gene_type:complete